VRGLPLIPVAEPQRNSFPAEIRFQRTPAEQAIPTEGLRIRLTDSGLSIQSPLLDGWVFALLTCGQEIWLASTPDFRYPIRKPTEHHTQLRPKTRRVRLSRSVSGMTEGWRPGEGWGGLAERVRALDSDSSIWVLSWSRFERSKSEEK
jgi:hypothetical protein